jgi:hypothetical protein
MATRCAMKLGPVRTLYAFSNLRKFVTAQEAFFTTDKDLIVCGLPASIEELGIVDTTCAISCYLGYLADEINLYSRMSNLKLITLWMKNTIKTMGHYIWDQRFGRKRYFNQEAVEHHKSFPGEAQDASGTGAEIADGEGNGYDSSENAESETGSEPYVRPEAYTLPEWKKRYVAAGETNLCHYNLSFTGIEIRGDYHGDRLWTEL